jgi:hypothetical protein
MHTFNWNRDFQYKHVNHVTNYVRRPVVIFLLQDCKLRHYYSASFTAGTCILAIASASFYFVYVIFRFKVQIEQFSRKPLRNWMSAPYLSPK